MTSVNYLSNLTKWYLIGCFILIFGIVKNTCSSFTRSLLHESGIVIHQILSYRPSYKYIRTYLSEILIIVFTLHYKSTAYSFGDTRQQSVFTLHLHRHVE